MSWKLDQGASFNEHRDKWDRINTQGPRTPLLDSRFIMPLLNYFGTGDETLALYDDSNETRAMSILSHSKRGVWTTMQPSQAPIGAWVSQGEKGLGTLAAELMENLPGIPLLLGITQQDPALIPRPAHDSRVRTIDYIRTASIRVEGGFDEYWAQRGRNLRQNLKRQRNRLAKDGIITKMETITDPEQVPATVAEYGRIESSGWKTQTGTAIHPENIQGKFYTEMLQNFSLSGDCRIFCYRYNNQIVAMDLCITGGGTLIILKTTYDERQTSSSPAMLMRQEAFNQIFEEGNINNIEFYGKVMDWHTKWTSDMRTMYHLNCYRWSILARLHGSSSHPST